MAQKKPNTTTSIKTWDFQNRHVQEELEFGKFTHGKHVLLCAGPPKLRHLGATGATNETGVISITDTGNQGIAFPIGITDSFQLQSTKEWRRIFEIGSDRAYMLPGHVTHSGNMARVMYNGASLLKVTYAYYSQRFPKNSSLNGTNIIPPTELTDINGELPKIYEAPGKGDLFLNLASDLYDHTMGLLVIFQDNERNQIGSIYLEENAIQGHNLTLDANNSIMVEGCNFLPNRVVPVDVSIEKAYDNEKNVWSTT